MHEAAARYSSLARTTPTLKPPARMMFFVALLLLSSAVSALDPRYTPTQYRIESWGTLDGLPGASISALYQDSGGYLWVGTYRGAARFDGYQFTDLATVAGVDIPQDVIRSIVETGDGTLWFAGERRGLVAYDNSGEVYRFFDGDQSGAINYLHEDNNQQMWIATSTMLYRMQGRLPDVTFVPELAQSVWQLTQSSSGDLWAATEQGLWFKSNQGWQLHDEPQLNRAHLWSLVFSGDDLWVGWRGGLSKLSGADWRHYQAEQGELPHAVIRNVLTDDNGMVWIATAGGGLARYDQNGFSRVTQNQGLASDVVWVLIEDREGNIWAGGSGGLSRISDVAVQVFGRSEGVESSLVWSVAPNGPEGVLLGTNGDGLLSLNIDSGAVQKVGPELGQAGAGIVLTAHRLESGDTIFGTFVGAYRLGSDNRAERIETIPDGRVRVLMAGDDGVLWVASDRGIGQLRGNQYRDLTGRFGLESVATTSLYKNSDGSLLATAESGGLWLLPADLSPATRLDRVATKMPTRDVWRDVDGTIWVAGFGLHRLEQGEWVPVDSINRRLPAQFHALVEDPRGWLWASTNVGVARISIPGLRDHVRDPTSTPDAKFIGVMDGMRSAEANGGNQHALLLDDKGRLLVPTTDGVAVIDPENMGDRYVPPHPLIERVLIDEDKPYAWTERALPAGTERLRIEFTALRLSDPERIHFRYRLEPSEPEWTDIGRQRSVGLSRLSPGDYTFSIQAAGADEIWGTPTVIDFAISPYWWQRGWVQIAFALFAAAMLISLPLLRIRVLRHRAAELRREVSIRTSELARANAALEEAARTDALTGLPNRRHFMARLVANWMEGGPLCLATLDIDHFKRYNDSLGHLMGDSCLQQLGLLFRQELSGPGVLVGRVGGEEFSVFFRASLEEGEMRLRQLTRQLALAAIPHPNSVSPLLTISIGLAERRPGDVNDGDLRERADLALYQAKAEGRNRLCIAD